MVIRLDRLGSSNSSVRAMSSAGAFGLQEQGMTRVGPNPVVHLELHTGNLPRACAFLTQMFGWDAEQIDVDGCRYLSLELGGGIDGGVVERDAGRPLWLPYVQVTDVFEAAERADLLGAVVLLEPREGPAGWRSVIGAPDGGRLGLWQPKRFA
jgi:predicted enzyme related to lactoylglutathione lyase